MDTTKISNVEFESKGHWISDNYVVDEVIILSADYDGRPMTSDEISEIDSEFIYDKFHQLY